MAESSSRHFYSTEEALDLVLEEELDVEGGGDGIFFPGSDDELGFIEEEVIDDDDYDDDDDDGGGGVDVDKECVDNDISAETKYEVHNYVIIIPQ